MASIPSDSFMAHTFSRTERDKENEKRNKEVLETHNSIEKVVHSTMKRHYHETSLMKRLHAVCASLPIYKNKPD